jgi:methylmalonyl-CoA mutase
MSGRLALASDFPAASRDDWRALVAAVLRRGGPASDLDPEDRLSSLTYDGIVRRPLYTSADGPVVLDLAIRAPGADGWDVRQRYAGSDPVTTNRAVLADLSGGVTSVWLAVGADTVPTAELGRALDGVDLGVVPLVLDAGQQPVEAANSLLALAEAQGIPRSRLRGSFGADPLATRMRTGAGAEVADVAELAELTAGTGLVAVTVDGSVYHDAGGSDSDELAAVAAVAVEYLRVLSDAGATDPFGQLEFRYAVTADQFGSIVKLRAARRIWARIAELSGARAEQKQHAVTSSAMLTRRDPWTNILRNAIACFAAAAGGAQSITVGGYDEALGQPDDFARRIARNTHAVIRDESSLGRVVDPARGSWYVEALTEQLAEVAWTKFTALERAGGASSAWESGSLAALLSGARDQRTRNIATRRDPIIGVSVFPSAAQEPVAHEPVPQEPAAATSGAVLPVLRYAQDWEALRDRADAHADRTGERPRILLAALGPADAYSARLAFASDLFEVAGIEPLVRTGTADDLAAGFDPHQTPVVCLCSSDAVYADQALAVAESIRAAGAQRLLLAGKPRTDVTVDSYVFVGSDVLAVLRGALDAMGVAA